MFVPVDELPSRAAELMPPGTVTLSCVAYDPTEYDAERRAMHERGLEYAKAAGQPVPFIYDGSRTDYCQACNIRVGVGPKQQTAIAAAEQYDVGVNVFCLLCGSVLTVCVGSGEASVINLGNRQEPPT